MLKTRLAKIDRFYPIFAVVVLGIIILIIFTLRAIFTAVNTASEFDPELGVPSTKVEKSMLDSVLDKVKNKNVPSLRNTP